MRHLLLAATMLVALSASAVAATGPTPGSTQPTASGAYYPVTGSDIYEWRTTLGYATPICDVAGRTDCGPLDVNIVGGSTGSGGNAAAGPTGSAPPSSADNTGFTNAGGNLVGVSPSAPLPTTGTVTQGPAAAANAPWYVAPGTGATFPTVAPAAGNGTDVSNTPPTLLTSLKTGTVTHPGQLYVMNESAGTLQLMLQGATVPILIGPGGANSQGGDQALSLDMPWFTGTYTIYGASGAQFFANSN